MHDCLLTNYQRSIWDVGILPICYICRSDDEIDIHTLRDCIYATQTWIRLVTSNYISILSSHNRDMKNNHMSDFIYYLVELEIQSSFP
jgi:hypothetical protein